MTQNRHYLFLQGPHGPFFSELSKAIRAAGHKTSRIGINAGDAYYWHDKNSYFAFCHPLSEWKLYLADHLQRHRITDIVVYGDTRNIHRVAKKLGADGGQRLHCFEEGYLRPYWITYERGGANANSRVLDFSLDAMRALVDNPDALQPEAPAQWGAMWHHTFLGSIYHAQIVFRNGNYPNYVSHRAETVRQEWVLHCKRLLKYPFQLIQRRVATRRLLATGLPYHVALLQLGHDASVQDHSKIGSMSEFINVTMEGFAKGAPAHHQLVFKAHPLEDGREPLPKLIKSQAARLGLDGRVWFIHGGMLGPLLDGAKSAITVNSTAGQQALWRGLPLKAFGRSVYDKPDFVSPQSVANFFQSPKLPDAAGYRVFRQFLLETSQISGGYYTSKGRRSVKRAVVDLMLADCDTYDSISCKNSTMTSKLQVVSH